MTSKTAALLKALRAEIISGELASGARLKEEEIAARFGVSRVPVREALRQLESEGFAVAERYKGVTVADRSARAVIELMQVRRGLEVLAAGLAADRCGGDVADALREVSGQRGGSPARRPTTESSLNFHRLVARATDNHQLEQMLGRLLDQTAWGFEQDADKRIEASERDHAAIASAIINGQRVQAGYLMDEHLLKNGAVDLRAH